MGLQEICAGVWCAEHRQKFGLGFVVPCRMTVVRLASGGLWIHAPGPMDEARAARIGELGRVEYLVAPNLFHHLHLPAAAERFPEAEVHAAPGLERKRPDVTFAGTLGVAAPWGDEIQPIPIDGMPSFREVVFVHRPSGSLLVADLLFNLRRRLGPAVMTYLRLTGGYGRVAQSRVLRLAVRDRPAAAASCLRVLCCPFDRLVPCHGEIVEQGAKRQVEKALSWLLRDLERPPDAQSVNVAVPEV